MFNNDFVILFGICWLIALVFTIVLLWDRKKAQPVLVEGSHKPLQMVQTYPSNFPPALIDRPMSELSDLGEITIEKDTSAFEARLIQVEDEESFLLKAAEIVVEKVQDVLNSTASNSPTPENVISNIKRIVNPYTIFKDTEYFDAINSFIAVSVERDTGISLNKEQLLSLWL